MSTFTTGTNDVTSCDSCGELVGHTWQAKTRHFLDRHSPAIYHATRSAEQEDKT